MRIGFLFIFLALISPVSYGCNTSVLARVHSGQSRNFESLFRVWDDEMVTLYQSPPTGNDIPHALPRFSFGQRLRNSMRIYRAGPEIKKAVGEMGVELSRGEAPQLDASRAIERVTDAIVKSHFRDLISNDLGRHELSKSKNAWLSLMGGLGAGNIPYHEVQEFTSAYFKRIAEFKTKYGAHFFPEAAVNKAGFDAFAMVMLAKLAHTKVPTIESVYALSLLHPITDAAIDRHENIGNAMEKLTQLLRGVPVKAETPYEHVIFDLVNTIFTEYPESAHPLVKETLLALQLEQLKSVRLQGQNASNVERLHNSLRKGSLTALVFGYLSFGKLTDKQTEYFYKAGGMLQLIDDLLDISSDLAENNSTVWTQAHIEKGGNLEDPMRRLFHLQKYLEEQGPQLLSELSQPQDFLRAFEFGFRLFIYSSVFDPVVAKGTKTVLKDRLPLSPEALVQVVYDTFGASAPNDTVPILGIFDTGFLNGRFAKEGRPKQSKGPGIEVSNPVNPLWWGVKLSDKLHRGFGEFINPTIDSPKKAELRRLVIIASGFGYVIDLNHQLSSVGLAGIVPFSLFYTADTFFKNPTKGIGIGMGSMAIAHLLAAIFGEDDELERKAKEERYRILQGIPNR